MLKRFRKEFGPLLASTGAGALLTAAGTLNARYTWPLFLGVPALMGFLAVVLKRDKQERSALQCMAHALAPLWIVALFLLVFWIEGVMCLLMASPIAILLAMLGGFLGWLVRRRGNETVIASCTIIPLWLFLTPGGPHPHDFKVRTSILINAPPEQVWQFVGEFPELPQPTELIFRAGIAAPLATALEAPRPGASRECILSTGIMRERVTEWAPPYRLLFDVLSTPPAMKELTPYGAIDLPHLHGFYVSRRGEFELQALPGSRTLLIGTSWYSHGLQPAQYWRLWSDYVVHKVHQRVLAHIKHLAEAGQLGQAPQPAREYP